MPVSQYTVEVFCSECCYWHETDLALPARVFRRDGLRTIDGISLRCRHVIPPVETIRVRLGRLRGRTSGAVGTEAIRIPS